MLHKTQLWVVIMDYSFVRNVFAVWVFIFLIYLLYTFYSGGYVNQHLDGVWVSVCGTIEFIFDDGKYTRNGESFGEFGIRGNLITFSNGSTYSIIIRARHSYMIIDGVYFLNK